MNTRTGNPPTTPVPIRLLAVAFWALCFIVGTLTGIAAALGSAIIVSLIESNPL